MFRCHASRCTQAWICPWNHVLWRQGIHSHSFLHLLITSLITYSSPADDALRKCVLCYPNQVHTALTLITAFNNSLCSHAYHYVWRSLHEFANAPVASSNCRGLSITLKSDEASFSYCRLIKIQISQGFPESQWSFNFTVLLNTAINNMLLISFTQHSTHYQGTPIGLFSHNYSPPYISVPVQG